MATAKPVLPAFGGLCCESLLLSVLLQPAEGIFFVRIVHCRCNISVLCSVKRTDTDLFGQALQKSENTGFLLFIQNLCNEKQRKLS